uniref:Uncharacterized protein n=1 Tax=Acrobeloides nanus TaxID=290746 RepID=A0A914ECU3_9BILA
MPISNGQPSLYCGGTTCLERELHPCKLCASAGVANVFSHHRDLCTRPYREPLKGEILEAVLNQFKIGKHNHASWKAEMTEVCKQRRLKFVREHNLPEDWAQPVMEVQEGFKRMDQPSEVNPNNDHEASLMKQDSLDGRKWNELPESIKNLLLLQGINATKPFPQGREQLPQPTPLKDVFKRPSSQQQPLVTTSIESDHWVNPNVQKTLRSLTEQVAELREQVNLQESKKNLENEVEILRRALLVKELENRMLQEKLGRNQEPTDTLDSELTNLENEKPTVGQPTDDQEMESEPNELDDVADQ